MPSELEEISIGTLKETREGKLNQMIDAFLGTLFPRNIVCMACGEEIWTDQVYSLCPTCKGDLPWNKGLTCKMCGITVPPTAGDRCYTCQTRRFFYDQGVSCLTYEGAAKQLIMDFKYNERTYLGIHLGDMLYDLVGASLGWDYDYIVPVPMHKSRLQVRGYNQTAILADQLSKRSGVPVSQGLIRSKKTPRLKRLDAATRKTTLDQAFHVTAQGMFGEKRILLVDDIVTTGATLNQCAEVLKVDGARLVDMACIASNPLAHD